MNLFYNHHGKQNFHGICHGTGHSIQDKKKDNKLVQDLVSFKEGSFVRIKQVIECPCLRCRVFALGLTPGTLVEIVSSGRGPCHLKVRGSDVIIGGGIAKKILAVEEKFCPARAIRR